MLRPARILPLGPACFSLLGVLILARAAAVFLPCERWGENAGMCAESYLFLPSGQARTFVADAAIADGARLTNRLDFLSFRSERFTVDERGYRNPPGMDAGRLKAVLVGDSYSLGVSLSDDEIFSTRLNRRLGPVVYNTAAAFNASIRADRIVETARDIGMNRGWILFEVVNREPLRFGPPSSGESLRHDLRQRLKNSRSSLVPSIAPAISLLLGVFVHPAALTRAATLLNMHLHDDRLLPNPFKDLYSEEQLIDGRRVLVYAGDKQFALHPEGLEITADTLLRLRDELGRHGYRLAVLLLPNGYSVYCPFYRDRPAGDPSAAYMAGLAARLRERGVPAFDLLPALREAARKELADGRLIYFSDDAHWNARGCELAAGATAPWLGALLGVANPAQDDPLP